MCIPVEAIRIQFGNDYRSTKISRAGFENDFSIEEYSRDQLSFATSTRANDEQKAMKIGSSFLLLLLGLE